MKKIILLTLLFLSATTIFAQSNKKTNTLTKSTSVSVSNSDDAYTLTASFDNMNPNELRTIISNALGTGLKTGDNGTIWQINGVYTVTLKSEKLAMELDKDKASGTLTKSFIKLGKDIDQAINHSAPATTQTPVN